MLLCDSGYALVNQKLLRFNRLNLHLRVHQLVRRTLIEFYEFYFFYITPQIITPK